MAEHRNRPRSVERVEHWVDETVTPPGDRPKHLDGDGTPDAGALRRQQQAEMRTTGLGTQGQFHGAVAGTVIGAVIGGLIGVLVGWFILDGLSTIGRIGLPLILGAAAGAAIGFVYLGGRMPELENETLTAHGDPQIGTTPRDHGTDERGR
jgi:hypothetical protein